MKRTATVLIALGLTVIVYFGFLLPPPEGQVEISRFGLAQETVHWQPYLGILFVLVGVIVLVINANQKDEKTLFEEDPAD
jgi:hypothetical protein